MQSPTIERRFAVISRIRDRGPDGSEGPPLLVLTAQAPNITVANALVLWWQADDVYGFDPWRSGKVYMRPVTDNPFRLMFNDVTMRSDTAYHVDCDIEVTQFEFPQDGVYIRLLPPSEFHENYELAVKLGEGGFGTVFRAHNRTTNRAYAVKEIRIPDSIRAASEQYLVNCIHREIDIMSRVKHKNLVCYKEIFVEDNGRFNYIVMELGISSLASHMSLHSESYSAPLVRRVTSQVCSGVDYLHTLGIVHRDLKPQNIVIMQEKPRMEIKVMDYGLSKSTDGTNLVSFCGTLAYMAPEIVANGGHYDHKVDSYALGWVVAVLLVGQWIMDSDIRNKIKEPRRLAKTIIRHIPDHRRAGLVLDDIRDFLEKLLDPCPAKRMSVAEALKHPYLGHRTYTHANTQRQGPSLLRTQRVSKQHKVVKPGQANGSPVAHAVIGNAPGEGHRGNPRLGTPTMGTGEQQRTNAADNGEAISDPHIGQPSTAVPGGFPGTVAVPLMEGTLPNPPSPLISPILRARVAPAAGGYLKQALLVALEIKVDNIGLPSSLSLFVIFLAALGCVIASASLYA